MVPEEIILWACVSHPHALLGNLVFSSVICLRVTENINGSISSHTQSARQITASGTRHVPKDARGRSGGQQLPAGHTYTAAHCYPRRLSERRDTSCPASPRPATSPSFALPIFNPEKKTKCLMKPIISVLYLVRLLCTGQENPNRREVS